MSGFEPHAFTLKYKLSPGPAVTATAETAVFFLDPVGTDYKIPKVCRTTLGSISTAPFTIEVENKANDTYHQLKLCFALDIKPGTSLFMDAIAAGSDVKVNLIVTVVGEVAGVPTILAGDSLQLTLIKDVT